MNLRKVSLYLLCLTVGVLSCKKDDEPDPVVIEIRDRAEQQIEDMVSLNAYLDTHYYNSEEIESLGTSVSISDIVIYELAEGQTAADVPVGHTLLRTAVGAPKTTTYADTDYEFYVLSLNQGGGTQSPKFCDRIRFNYEGFTLDDVVFDYSVNPFVSNLIGNGVDDFGLIIGWSKVIPDFNTAESFVENSDGTVSYVNKGVGIMFLPSGLAYFSSATTGIAAYSPIIFKFELLQMSENDHDGDGVPSYLEDLNGDRGFLVNYDDLTDTTDDDTDGDGTPDYIDLDDDGDGILTIDEDINKDGDPTNDDSNGNGIPNYLDKTDKIKKS
ncbi:FKBP-type peptidyl-prolyl cis-trans isomerase [Mariniflexile sp. HNIBRBA6329]|uniref:FKBP-type peptidyl-prolyl cis-trans isomerase n=1 Tax=Mariniflexile sp. HNIBRBA6329 TaxID=3373088 RepID=UPI003746C0A5